MRRRMGIRTAFSQSEGFRISEEFLKDGEHFVQDSRL